jgi:hypothetical protein
MGRDPRQEGGEVIIVGNDALSIYSTNRTDSRRVKHYLSAYGTLPLSELRVDGSSRTVPAGASPLLRPSAAIIDRLKVGWRHIMTRIA